MVNSTISSESLNVTDNNSTLHSSEFNDDELFKELYHEYVLFTKREAADNRTNNDLYAIRRNKHNNYLHEKNTKLSVKPSNDSNKLKLHNHVGKKNDVTGDVMGKRKSILTLSDSMLNQIDETRLRKYGDVHVRCHGGCTVSCMYSHLPTLLCDKPDCILLHISTNDCVSETSDQALMEIINLTEHMEKILPTCTVVVSQPTLRTDNVKANNIIGNLNIKLKRNKIKLLDNSNIKTHHLGKKGLHLMHMVLVEWTWIPSL